MKTPTIFSVIILLFSGLTYSNQSTELADMQARIATLEAKLSNQPKGDSAEFLTSLKKKGSIRIGGIIAVDTLFIRRSEANAASDKINRYIQIANDADLDIRVDAGSDTYLFCKLDLDDTRNDGDLTEELQFVWQNVRGSNWTLIFGKDEVAFGQDRYFLISEPYAHGQGGLLAPVPERTIDSNLPTAKTGTKFADSEENFHEHYGIMPWWTGEVDNRWGITASYKYKQLGSLEITAFQDIDDMHEDRPEDSGIQSWATRLKVIPGERFTLTASFINQHRDSMDEIAEHIADGGVTADGTASLGGVSRLGELADTRLRAIVADRQARGLLSASSVADFNANGPAVDDDQMATSLAFNYYTKNSKWNIYGEWIYTWHSAHFEELSAHVFSLGALYNLSPKIKLIARADHANISNGVFKQLGINFEERYFHAGTGIRYNCDNGITFVAEYSHEWYSNTLSGWDSGSADAIGFRTLYIF